MDYKNTVTGVVISTPCVISGGDWVPFNKELTKEKIEFVSTETQEPEQPEKKTDSVPDGITKKQIMQELDAFDVKYDKRWGEKRLYDLMMQQGE